MIISKIVKIEDKFEKKMKVMRIATGMNVVDCIRDDQKFE